jgi:hypothetical protein
MIVRPVTVFWNTLVKGKVIDMKTGEFTEQAALPLMGKPVKYLE